MPTLSAKLIATLKRATLRQRPFADQRGGQRKRNLLCFWLMLDALSGGDIVSFLRHIFSSRKGRPLLEQLGLESKDTSQRAFEALRLLHTSASSRKEKRAVLSAVAPLFTRTQLWKWGLRFSPATLTRASRSTQSGGSATPNRRPGPLPSAPQRAKCSASLKKIRGKQRTGL